MYGVFGWPCSSAVSWYASCMTMTTTTNSFLPPPCGGNTMITGQFACIACSLCKSMHCLELQSSLSIYRYDSCFRSATRTQNRTVPAVHFPLMLSLISIRNSHYHWLIGLDLLPINCSCRFCCCCCCCCYQVIHILDFIVIRSLDQLYAVCIQTIAINSVMIVVIYMERRMPAFARAFVTTLSRPCSGRRSSCCSSLRNARPCCPPNIMVRGFVRIVNGGSLCLLYAGCDSKLVP